jgi:hypothetical protein
MAEKHTDETIINAEDYQVQYDSESATVEFVGQISLGGPKDYAPIVNILNKAVDSGSSVITLDLKKLEFLNSSGISMLSKFVLGMRKNKGIQLIVIGSKKIPWQNKSLRNLERLLPGLKLVFQ